MFRKKEDWWQRSNEEQNAEMAKADTTAAQSDAATPEAAAQPAPKAKKPKKKHRWDWWDAAGDILEVVFDFIAGLFD